MAKASYGEMGAGSGLNPAFTYWTNFIRDNKRKVRGNPSKSADIINDCINRGCSDTEVAAIVSILDKL